MVVINGEALDIVMGTRYSRSTNLADATLSEKH